MNTGGIRSDSEEESRPRPLIMLTGLYFFLLVLTAGSYGHPVALMGSILEGTAARIFIAINTIVCLYLFIGLWQKQRLTWYFLIAYNLLEVANTLVSLLFLPRTQLERIQGTPIDSFWLVLNNLATVAAILWVSSVIYRNRPLFSNRSPYLF